MENENCLVALRSANFALMVEQLLEKMTIDELVAFLDVTKQTIRNWAKGRHKPQYKNYIQISKMAKRYTVLESRRLGVL